MTMTAAEALRDYVVDGVPSSGVHEPKKSDLRNVIGGLELKVNAGGLGGAIWKATKALLAADLAHAADKLAVVYDDGVSANNGTYVKIGPSGGGSWSQITTFLPGYQFVTAVDDGESTANAYTMDTNPRLPAGDGVALVEFVVPETNTSATVTVSFDGDAPLTIKTASGNEPVVGGLVEGMPVSGVKVGSNFFMRSDQASAAIQTAAEAAAADAEAAAIAAADYAALALNNFVRNSFVGTGSQADFTLTIDPGSANNMFVNVNGVLQAISAYTLEYVSTIPTLRFSSAPPDGVEVDVRFGSKITVGTPSDGSVTNAKIGADAITADKISAADAAAIRTKIGAAASGVAVTNAQMPTGSVVDTKSASYSANASLTSVIPRDDTIPQKSEGTEILSLSITPKSTTNKLRCRFQGQFARSAVGHMISAIFADGTGISGSPANARSAQIISTATLDYGITMTHEVEFVPGTTNAVTVSVNVGPDASAGFIRLNGVSGARLLGGASAATLVVEEIKA